MPEKKTTLEALPPLPPAKPRSKNLQFAKRIVKSNHVLVYSTAQ